jgi:hypothetical protein
MLVKLHFEFRDGLLVVLDGQYDTLLGKEFLEALAARLGGPLS